MVIIIISRLDWRHKLWMQHSVAMLRAKKSQDLNPSHFTHCELSSLWTQFGWTISQSRLSQATYRNKKKRIYHHHHHNLHVVLTDRCAAPWPLKISVLHRDESGITLASSWTRLSQVRRGRPGGLVQLVDGFLPSWLFTIKSKALFAGTSESKRTT